MTTKEVAGRRGAWIAAIVASAAALVVYVGIARTTSFEFLNYDDVYVVARENPAIGKGLLSGLPDLLSPAKHPQFMNAWLPLYYWSLGLDHALGGGAAWVFHLHSALLHAFCAALVALIARRLGATNFVAGLAGVVFAVHPVATESVAWVASRKDVLSFAWMGLAAVCYLDAIAKRRPALHLVGALCLLISMLAKGTTLVLPLLLLVHAVVLRRDEALMRDRLRPVVPYAVVAIAMTGVAIWVAIREGTAGAAGDVGSLLVADLQVVWRYAVALFTPAPAVLSVEHGLTVDGVDARQAILGAAFAVAWIFSIAVTWKRSRPVAAFLLAVPLALLPFNNILPKTSVLFAERYCYVALLPVAIGAAWLLRPRSDGPASLLPCAVGVGLLATFCAMRLPTWHDSISLWEDAARKAPQSAIVECQLADAYATESRARTGADAEELATRATGAWRAARELAATDLEHLRAEAGLATQLLVTASTAKDAREQVTEAVARFESAESFASKVDAPGLRGQLVQILTNRATCRELLGETTAALADWRKAVQTDENSAQGWNALARLSLAAGRIPEMKDALAKSEKAAPHEPVMVRERARMRLLAGDSSAAKRDLADAIAANPDDVELLTDAARLDAVLLRPVDAEAKLRKALELKPGDVAIRDLLAAALIDQAQSQAARDDMPAAREAARKAGEVVPQSSAPEQLLGIVARRAGDLEEAAQHLRKARDLQPDGVRIREQLASVLVELAVQMLDAKREGVALILLEEAVMSHADVIATPKGRLDVGVSDWPPPAKDDDRAAVARNAALKGLAYLAVGRATDALTELPVAEIGTRDGDARLRRVVLRLLVRARFAVGRADEAVEAARELPQIEIVEDAAWKWKRHAEWAVALIERGTARRGAKNPAGSAEDFRAARAALDVAKSAGMPEAKFHVRLGEILFREEDFVAATGEFDRAIEASNDDLDAVLDRAALWRTQFLLHEDKAYLVDAERDFRRASEIAPSDPRVLAGLGETLVMGQKPADAFPLLQKAVLADPSQSGARALLADLAVRAGRSHLEKAVGAAETKKQEELADARVAADRAVALDPPTPDALVFLGDVLRAQGEWTTPLAKYELARERFPDAVAPRDAVAKFHMDRGHFYLLVKKRDKAVDDFRKALDVPDTTIDLTAARDRLHSIAVTTYGEAIDLDKAGKPAEAAERFAQSLLAEPTAEGHYMRGIVLSKADKLDDAVSEYDVALRMNPRMLDARLNRASTLLRVGRLDDAEAEFKTWLEAAPADDFDRGRVAKQLEFIASERREIEKETKK